MSKHRAGEAFDRLRGWLVDVALPFWSTKGVDGIRGGFFERMTPEGIMIDGPRRARLVSRQIYVFAHAPRLGWQGPADDLVRQGVEQLETRYFDRDGMVIALVDADGRPLSDHFDLYDHAFVLFAMAAAHASGIGWAVMAHDAAALRDRMRAGWSHPGGGFEEAMPPTLPLMANPHMHMLEACLAWSQTTTECDWDALADELADLCLSKLMVPPHGAIHEHFDGNWRPFVSDAKGVVEPGHQFEWAWLLMCWGQRRGNRQAEAAARHLVALAEAHGVDKERGLAINTLDAGLGQQDGLARLWPQTERIRVWAALAAVSQDQPTADMAWLMAAEACSGLMRFLTHPVAGAWWEHLGEDGEPLREECRASSLYHIVGAAVALNTALFPGSALRVTAC